MVAYHLSLLPRISSHPGPNTKCRRLQACQEDRLLPLPRPPSSSPLSSSLTKALGLMGSRASPRLVLLAPAQASEGLDGLLLEVLLLLRSTRRCLTVALAHLHRSQTTQLPTIELCNPTLAPS